MGKVGRPKTEGVVFVNLICDADGCDVCFPRFKSRYLLNGKHFCCRKCYHKDLVGRRRYRNGSTPKTKAERIEKISNDIREYFKNNKG